MREYAYLLGLYLGDGCIYSYPNKRTHRLQISLDSAYPGIVAECLAAVKEVSPNHHANIYRPRGEGYDLVYAYSMKWVELFPQHGPGKKHHRPILLAPWQREIVMEQHPGAFLRGLIHSDGWRGMNRVKVKGKWYQYPRYQFSSRSDDIRHLFIDACEVLEIAWRPWGKWHVSVARRDAVARLDEFVGPKY
jgi:hypothetical protein